ncbi:hypothetical protein [Nocardia brevicatena]|uniref:hypothetical protein n=1 Tax=Nocardia brevicatena TaxID=37327 RepID=UPI000592DF93|nr:hypothetical protein [Nocardia brevicatena]
MASTGKPAEWSVELFGDDVADVARYVVRGLIRGQRKARAVHAAARAEGSVDNYAYGSMWNTRYQVVVDEFELADLPGYEVIKPKGASYRLAVVKSCVLIPFRHATSMNKPISQAKLGSLIPRRLARESGVQPERTLFDDLADNTTDANGEIDSPTVGEVAAQARALNLTVVYIAYVANADSDNIQAAWWGTPISLEEDGTMVWFPEQLDLGIADQYTTGTLKTGLRVAGTATSAPGFAQGDEPDLDVTAKSRKDELPVSEIEPTTPDVASQDDD